MPDHTKDTEQLKSRSSIKRQMAELQKLGARLLDLSQEQLEHLSDEHLVAAVITAKKIKKNSARKRQLQFIGKLMRSTDIDEVAGLLDQFDSRSKQSLQHFHKLERWRAALISNDKQVMTEICLECPHTDRQHLRQLVRNAVNEISSQSDNSLHSRKLFRYLRDLVENPSMDI